jgi:hypothetical protein
MSSGMILPATVSRGTNPFPRTSSFPPMRRSRQRIESLRLRSLGECADIRRSVGPWKCSDYFIMDKSVGHRRCDSRVRTRRRYASRCKHENPRGR